MGNSEKTPISAAAMSDLVEAIVRKLDTNSDGYIDKHEFVVGLAATGIAPADAGKRFDLLDATGKGRLTRLELEAAMKAQRAPAPAPAPSKSASIAQMAAAILAKLDLNHDNYIDQMEFVGGLMGQGIAQDEATRQFERFDIKRTGRITLADIETVLKAKN